MELIDDGAVDEAGKASGSDAEGIADRRKCQYDAEVLSDAGYEVAQPGLGCIHDALRLGSRCYRPQKTVDFLLGEEIGDPSTGNNGIDVHQELLVRNVRVC